MAEKGVPLKDKVGSFFSKLNQKRSASVKTIIVVDEYFAKCDQDWKLFLIHKNVDILVAFHPRKDSRFNLTLPTSSEAYCCTLSATYRNSYEVLRLCSFFLLHKSLIQDSGEEQSYPVISSGDTESLKEKLPPGETPIWIELETDQIHPITIFRYIKWKYLKCFQMSSKVSFIIDDSHTHSEDVKKWLLENGYQQHTSSEFAQVTYSYKHSMRGLENEVFF